jgi:signal transduction histidine kinase
MKHDRHPVIWSFESLIFVVICDHGFLGILIYLIFFLLLLNVQRQFLKSRENILLVDLLVIFFFSYAVGTGEYGYMIFFALYYIFLMQYLKMNEISIQKDQNKILISNDKKSYIKFDLYSK